jgi:hypothetical protein
MRQNERGNELRTTLNQGKPGWNDDEPAVVETAFNMIIHNLFDSGYDARHIREFVEKIQTVMGGEPPVDQPKAEALIGRVFGRTDVHEGEINAGERFLLQGLIASCAVYMMGIDDEATVNEIISESERITFERGWKPSLARENRMPSSS